MIKEFREFIDKGNFLEIAVGFVMGVAFTTIVTTLVNRIINPAIGLVFGLDSLDAMGTFGDSGSVGALIAAIINFIVIALFLFFVVKAYNSLKREEAPADEMPNEEVTLLREIRDSLRSR